jgi:predicted RNA polymerase sigma factor
MLSRAIILAQLGRLEEAIGIIRDLPGIAYLLKHHYIYNAVLGDLYRQAGNITAARGLLENAYELTPSLAEKKLLRSKIEQLLH